MPPLALLPQPAPPGTIPVSREAWGPMGHHPELANYYLSVARPASWKTAAVEGEGVPLGDEVRGSGIPLKPQRRARGESC